MDRNFKDDLKRGLQAEKIVSEILSAKGIINFPLCQFDGATNGNGGPKIWGYNSGLLCPDFICIDPPTGKTFFIEVKSKKHAREYQTQKEYSLKDTYYTTFNGKLWKQHDEVSNNNRGNFYNNYVGSRIEFVVNDNPSTKKVFQKGITLSSSIPRMLS